MTKKKQASQVAPAQYTARIRKGEFSVGVWFDYVAQGLAAERIRSARVFQIAAALELKAAELGRRWPVSPDAPGGIIKIECDEHEKAEAVYLLAWACNTNNVSVVVL